MVKKIFVGVLLAVVFGGLVLSAVNRTLAKTAEKEPLALSENLFEEYQGGKGENNHDQNPIPNNDSDDCDADGTIYKRGEGFGQISDDCIVEPPSDGTGFQRGSDDQGNAFGTSPDGQPQGKPGDGLGVGQALVDEWITDNVVVQSVSPDVWVIKRSDDSFYEIDAHLLSYLKEQEFIVNVDDNLTLTGFFEGDIFEIGKIVNNTSGESVAVRDENGRPLWAGGRWGGSNP